MNIPTCPHCEMRVLPKSDGTCPSCGAVIERNEESLSVQPLNVSPPKSVESNKHEEQFSKVGLQDLKMTAGSDINGLNKAAGDATPGSLDEVGSQSQAVPDPRKKMVAMPNTRNIFPDASERRWSCILVGVIYWAIFGVASWLLYPIIEQSQGTDTFSIVLVIVLCCMGFLGIHFAIRGCDLGGQYRFRSIGYVLKMLVLILYVIGCGGSVLVTSLSNPTEPIVCSSVAGLISIIVLMPIVFWTGRGLLRRFYGYGV